MIGRPRNPDAKCHAIVKASVKKLMHDLDHERPTLLEIWGCGPCEEYPDGLIGLAELERMKRPLPEPEPVKNADLIMLPFGRGKLLGNQ